MSEEMAYCAGFFDADGSVGVYRKGVGNKNRPSKHKRLHITFTNTNKDVLEKIREILGYGGVHLKSKPKNPNWSQGHQLNIYSRQAAKVARFLIPYLKLKKQKMIDCLEEYESSTKQIRRPKKGQ